MAVPQVVDPLNGAQYFGLTAAPERGKLDMNAFLRLLTVQLSNQNPLEPMSDRDFFAQMAQLGQVEGMDAMQKSLQVSQAAAMLGKTVTAFRPMTETTSGMNEAVTGTVERLVVRNGEQKLAIREANGGIVEVGFGAIQSVEA